jgi:hypothetical protein
MAAGFASSSLMASATTFRRDDSLVRGWDVEGLPLALGLGEPVGDDVDDRWIVSETDVAAPHAEALGASSTRQVRQFKVPSLRVWMAVTGTGSGWPPSRMGWPGTWTARSASNKAGALLDCWTSDRTGVAIVTTVRMRSGVRVARCRA